MPALCQRCRSLAARGGAPHKELRSVRSVIRHKNKWERFQCFECGSRWDRITTSTQRPEWQLAAIG